MPAQTAKCPYCGFESRAEAEKRAEHRSKILRNCTLIRETGLLPARTIDISRKGIGLSMHGQEGLRSGEFLKLKVSDFDLELEAVVVWVSKGPAGIEKAGLKFV